MTEPIPGLRRREGETGESVSNGTGLIFMLYILGKVWNELRECEEEEEGCCALPG